MINTLPLHFESSKKLPWTRKAVLIRRCVLHVFQQLTHALLRVTSSLYPRKILFQIDLTAPSVFSCLFLWSWLLLCFWSKFELHHLLFLDRLPAILMSNKKAVRSYTYVTAVTSAVIFYKCIFIHWVWFICIFERNYSAFCWGPKIIFNPTTQTTTDSTTTFPIKLRCAPVTQTALPLNGQTLNPNVFSIPKLQEKSSPVVCAMKEMSCSDWSNFVDQAVLFFLQMGLFKGCAHTWFLVFL